MKIYIITVEKIIDYELSPLEICPFLTEHEARQFFNEKVKSARAEADDLDWEVQDDDEWCFSAGEMGYWCSNHMTVGLTETVTPEHGTH